MFCSQLENGQTRFQVNISRVVEILGSFPSEKYLEIEAIVFESATGKEERNKDNSVIFADSPFFFKLTNSKKSYRPGLTYMLKVLKLFFLLRWFEHHVDNTWASTNFFFACNIYSPIFSVHYYE